MAKLDNLDLDVKVKVAKPGVTPSITSQITCTISCKTGPLMTCSFRCK